MSKEEGLIEIAELAKRYSLTGADISAYLANQPIASKDKSMALSRILAYLGGTLMFAGIGVYFANFWDDLGSFMRVLFTLGVGIALHLTGYHFARQNKYSHAITPVFLLAVLFMTCGLYVTLAEFSSGGDVRHANLLVSLVMLASTGSTFWQLKRASLLLYGLGFFFLFWVSAFDLIGIREEYIAFIAGTSLLFLGYRVDNSPYRSIVGLIYFIGSISMMCGAWEILSRFNATIIYIAISSGVMWLSTLIRSRILLGIGTVSTLWYLGYYSSKYFGDSLGWPITLMLMGAAFIGLSSVALKLNKKYIKA